MQIGNRHSNDQQLAAPTLYDGKEFKKPAAEDVCYIVMLGVQILKLYCIVNI